MGNKIQRIHYMDIAKGIMIMFLVYHHILINTYRMGVKSFIFEIPNLFLSCFFMQAFFFISGYCSNMNKPLKLQLRTMFLTLMVPNIIFSVLPQLMHLEIYPWRVSRCIGFWHLGEWFLWALFWGKFIVIAICKYIKNTGWQFAAIFIILIITSVLYYIPSVRNLFFILSGGNAAFFIWIGMYIKQHKDIYEKCMKYSIFLYPILFILGFNIQQYMRIDIPTMTGGVCAQPQHLIYFLLFSISGTFFILAVSRWIGTSKILEYFGRGSLTVFITHSFSLPWIVKFMIQIVPPTSIVTRIECIMLICMTQWIILIGIIWLFKQKGFRILMGKIN